MWQVNLKLRKMDVMEEMGMTDNQWKDFLRGYKDDLEELLDYQKDGQTEAFEKKIYRMINRIQESLER